jgi:hypothetical protein
MQTIFRTIPTSHFIQLSNRHISNGMHSDDKNILNHLLSKPENWLLRVNEICKTLLLSEYKVRKALKRLRVAGYVFMERLRGGFTRWFVYSEPKSEIHSSGPENPALMPHGENSHVKNSHVLVTNKETIILKKLLPEPIIEPTPKNSVVVSSDNLIYPAQLNISQKKAAKHIIKKVKQPELQQDVLFALAYAMAQNNVKSAPAYLQGLVTRANNGTFEPVGSSTATKTDTRHIDSTQEKLKEYRQIKSSSQEKSKLFLQQIKLGLRGFAQ